VGTGVHRIDIPIY
jgi:hypothetical protein